MVERHVCTDCGCELQSLPSGWRCPWVMAGRQRAEWIGSSIALMCGWPYGDRDVAVKMTRGVSR